MLAKITGRGSSAVLTVEATHAAPSLCSRVVLTYLYFTGILSVPPGYCLRENTYKSGTSQAFREGVLFSQLMKKYSDYQICTWGYCFELTSDNTSSLNLNFPSFTQSFFLMK